MIGRLTVFSVLSLLAVVVRGADAALDRAKLELVVEQAGEMLSDSRCKGSATHGAAYQYYFGLVYGSGTNLLARKDSQTTTALRRKYMELVEKNYAAYTKVEGAFGKAVSTGNRHRAKRIASAEKLGDAELAKAIREWESFVIQLKKTR